MEQVDAYKAQRELCRKLSHWIYTDFTRAKAAIQDLGRVINAKTPHEIRLEYYRSAAFLDNQWNHYDDALKHARAALEIGQELRDHHLLIELWTDLASIYRNQRDLASAQECIENARKLADEQTPPEILAHISCREGFFYMYTNNFRKSLEAFMQAEQLLYGLGPASDLKERYLLTIVLTGLGELYERIDEKEKSLSAYRRILPIVEQYQLLPRIEWHYLNAGRAAMSDGDQERAGTYFQKVLEYAEEGAAEARTHALGNLGILDLVRNDVTAAAARFNEAAAQYEPPTKESDFVNLSKIELMRAGMHRQFGDLKATRSHLKKAWDLAKESHDKHQSAMVCQQLAAFEADQQQFKSAYEWQKQAFKLNQEYHEALHDLERRELEARHQIQRSRQEAQMARLRVAGLQLKALRAQMNPHFMFNALNAIQGLITSGRNSDAESYLAKFAKMMRHTLEYSDLEVVTLEQEFEFIERYLDVNRKLRFREKLFFHIDIPRGLDMDDCLVPTMILQPFVENAIEHGIRPKQGGNIRISFFLDPEAPVLHCVIEDDGIGFKQGMAKQSKQPVFQQHRSMGMEITRERLLLLHQLQKTGVRNFVSITDLGESSEGRQSGTRVEVLLPLMDDDDQT